MTSLKDLRSRLCVPVQPVARLVLLTAGQRRSGQVPAKTQHVVDKFCESFWKLSVYGTLLSLGVHALHDQPWLTESANFWRDWPVEALPCAHPLSKHTLALLLWTSA